MAAAMLAAERETLVFRCKTCAAECFPITDQSFCLCGHRLNAHAQGGRFSCARGGCGCQKFFYIITQGAWRLRCKCKHKATDHSVEGAHPCGKGRCECAEFESPFRCNCDHRWVEHEQVVEMRRPKTVMQILNQTAREATGGTVLRRGEGASSASIEVVGGGGGGGGDGDDDDEDGGGTEEKR